MKIPILSVIVVLYNMQREARRTLYTLSSKYQKDSNINEYEVLVVDNGSQIPVEDTFVKSFGANFHLIRFNPSPSPAASINKAVSIARGNLVMIIIDGARMLSPGIINATLETFKAFNYPLVATVAYHLGPKRQNISITEGYNQETEDLLLEGIDWKTNGYKLFSVSVLAGSSNNGWFLPLSESSCLTINKTEYNKINGYCESFKTPGGGFVNLDFYKRACENTDNLVILLGEGTFHQFHGGVATNVPLSQHPGPVFRNEYRQIRGYSFTPPTQESILFGKLPKESIPFLNYSVERLIEFENKHKQN
jgi:glycosyltransferase involved in cell wall biosynthesis